MAHPEGAMLIVFGVFTMVCSFMDYDFFMNNHKAEFFVNLLGRNGTRVFYFVLGLFLLIGGILAIR